METSRVKNIVNPLATNARDLTWMNYRDGRYVGLYDNIIKACQPH